MVSGCVGVNLFEMFVDDLLGEIPAAATACTQSTGFFEMADGNCSGLDSVGYLRIGYGFAQTHVHCWLPVLAIC